jgi:hypothetical protein
MCKCVRLERRERKDYFQINNDKKGTGGKNIKLYAVFRKT